VPSPAYLFAGIVFSTIGFAAAVYGRKQAKWSPMLFGAGLVLATFVVQDTTLLCLVGGVLCAAMYWFRD
jgi:hypothetical protein